MATRTRAARQPHAAAARDYDHSPAAIRHGGVVTKSVAAKATFNVVSGSVVCCGTTTETLHSDSGSIGVFLRGPGMHRPGNSRRTALGLPPVAAASSDENRNRYCCQPQVVKDVSGRFNILTAHHFG